MVCCTSFRAIKFRMAWSVEFDAERGVVQTVYAGALSRSELLAAVDATLDSAREQQSRLLFADCSALADGHSLFDLYDAAVTVSVTPHALPLREAILMPDSAGASDRVTFWETAATNRGMQVKLFTDRDQALAWLTAVAP